MVPDVPAIFHVNVAGGALDNDDLLHRGALFEGGVAVLLHGGELAAPETLVGGDDEGGVAVVDPVPQGLGGEAAEDDAVDGAYAGTGEHGEGQFGDHGHVESHPVALLDPVLLQNVGEPVDFIGELKIGEGLVGAVVAFPDDGSLVAPPTLAMPVDAVYGGVELPAFEPLDVGLVEVVIQYLVPLLGPGDVLLRLLRPETLGIFDGLLVHLVVLFHAGDVSDLLHLLGRRKGPLFVHEY